MKYIDNSFMETAVALMIINPACQRSFLNAGSLADYMRAFAERELNNAPNSGGTFGFEISTFMSSGFDPVLCAKASVMGYTAAKAAAALIVAKEALSQIERRLGANGGPTKTEITDAHTFARKAITAMEA